LILHPLGGTEVVLDGATRCRETLLRDNPGPRAVLNALERLADGYERECGFLKSQIAVKEGQLRDYEGRVGRVFQHEEYKSQLTDLRDQLKRGLSEHPPEGATPVAELAERIRELRAANTVEAAPERTGTRRTTRAEKPVTARIRERVAVEEVKVEPVEEKPAPVEPERTEPIAQVIAMPEAFRPANGHVKTVTRRRNANEDQLRLF
jgi:hypothetical protein